MKENLYEQPILVAGLVRNCAKSLKLDIQKIQQALNAFKHVQWLLIESDSTDNTLQVLESLVGPSFSYRSLGKLQDKYPLRTDRIAHCRNQYLIELETNPLYAKVKYLMVADLDGLNTHLSSKGIASCWIREDWDACMANQAGPYYDIWALRHADWSPNDCWKQAEFLMKNQVSRYQALQQAVYSRMVKLSPEQAWIEVESAFGGFAVYRREALKGIRYCGLTSSGEQICEHVMFHQQMLARLNSQKIYINPMLINAAYTEHTKHLTRTARLVRFCKECVKLVINLCLKGESNPIKR